MMRMGWMITGIVLALCSWQASAKALSDSALYYESGMSRVVSSAVFAEALANYRKVQDQHRPVLTIIDYSKPSNQKRLFILDVQHGQLLFSTWVSHGRNSGDERAYAFSDQPNSLQSSLGLYRTGETYLGKYGYSLRLDGLTPGKNLNARRRDIVLHGAPYASPDHIRRFGKLGRSWGCPAVPLEQANWIIELIKGGSIIYAHG